MDVERLATKFEERPRDEDDLAAATALRDLFEVYRVAREVVQAKQYQQRLAAYSHLENLIKGKKGE